MKVKSKKIFASTVFGNVSRGQILECSDGHAKHLIEAGLVDPLEYDPILKSQNIPDPTPPAAEDQSGPSSQAGQASQSETANESESGGTAKPDVKARSKKKRAKSRS